MTDATVNNMPVVRQYLHALETGAGADILRQFFTEDAVQIEMPNQLNRKGQRSDLKDLLERSRQGSKVLREQRFEIVSEMAEGERVVVEARWTGVLAVALGSLPAGAEMGASFAMFFTFRDGRIAEQRNYDCFDPW